MIHQKEGIGAEGVQFFGKISASISHELKNAFTVISESAGLLEDYSVMAERGAPLDPARLMKAAAAMRKHIRRANGIVEKMNRFAHSADDPVKTVDLGQMLALVLSLVDRQAQMKEVTLEMSAPDPAVCITTYPFVLENLVWRCIGFALDAAGGDKRLVVTAAPTTHGAEIRLSRVRGMAEHRSQRFPSEIDAALAHRLGAEIDLRSKAGDIVITLPNDIDR